MESSQILSHTQRILRMGEGVNILQVDIYLLKICPRRLTKQTQEKQVSQGTKKVHNSLWWKYRLKKLAGIFRTRGKKTGLRKSRYEGTNQGTKGTILNETLLLLPRFPHKNGIFGRYLDFRIGKKMENRGTNCALIFNSLFNTSISEGTYSITKRY